MYEHYQCVLRVDLLGVLIPAALWTIFVVSFSSYKYERRNSPWLSLASYHGVNLCPCAFTS